MKSKNEIKSALEKIATHMTIISKPGMKEDYVTRFIDFETWEWPEGVGLYGLFKYYQETGEKQYLEYLEGWYDRRIKEGLPEKNVNTMAPMLALAYLYEISGNEQHLKLCKEWAEWVMKEMPRTNDHGLQHIVTGGRNEQQLWDDTLYMTVLFLAKIGTVLKRQDYIDESIRQFLVHIKYLFDKKTGLWFHGWTFIEKCNFANALWARGNCWITAGIPDFIEMINLEGGVKQYIVDTFTAQVEALSSLQAKNGMWHTLLDDPNSYVETSATAGFGYGILKGVRMGYLDKKYLSVGEKALEAVLERIAEDGIVEEVSYGTGMGWDLEHYRNIRLCPMAYGQSLAVLFLSEGIKL